jgi:hypothetical protein
MNRTEIEAAMEAVAARERKRQSTRAVIVVAAIMVFAGVLLFLAYGL